VRFTCRSVSMNSSSPPQRLNVEMTHCLQEISRPFGTITAPVGPSVVIFGINIEHRSSKVELPRRVAGSLHDSSPVVPNLIILWVLLGKGVQVVQFLSKIGVQMRENLSSVLPTRRVKTVERSEKEQTRSCSWLGSFREDPLSTGEHVGFSHQSEGQHGIDPSVP
jgi:hypothetical protein